MTFDANLKKIQQQSVVELYHIRSGDSNAFYTSADRDITFLGRVYRASSIRRTGFSSDTQMGEVRVSITASMLASFIAYIADQPVTPTEITIHQALADNLTQYRVLFHGKVFNLSTKDRVVSAQCVANSEVLKSRIPGVLYQSFCNHHLFDAGCKLTDTGWRVLAAVVSVTGAAVTASAFAAKPDHYFTGGWLAFEDNARLITRHVGNTVNLHVPFDSRVTGGTTLWAYPGCDGNPETCKAKFNNFDNFLGMPIIPSHNPVLWGFAAQ